MSAETEPQSVPVAPLMPVALAILAGVVTDRYAGLGDTPAWAAVALIAGVAGLRLRRARFAGAAALALSLLALGGAWHHHRWSDLPHDDLARSASETTRPVWLRGVLVEVLGTRHGVGPRDSTSTRALLQVTGIHDGRSWRGASGMVQMIVTGECLDLEAGRGFEAAGGLGLVSGPLNPGEFDYRNYLRAQGIRLRLTVHGGNGVRRDPGAPVWPWTRRLGRVRRWSHDRLVAGLDPEVAPLAAALLLGRREAVDPSVNDAFARTGTTHLLAISGLHLQALAGVLWFACRALGLGRSGSFATVALATVAYALLVGLMPSVVRSAAMTVGVCGGGLICRQCRPANLLAWAALATIAHNPAHLFDVGGQLSFLAIVAIFWGVPPVRDLLRFGCAALSFRGQAPRSALDQLERRFEPRWRAWARRSRELIVEGFVVSLVVWLAALPLVALRFHLVSPIGVLLNLPLIPLTSAALLASGLALALSSVWAPLGMPAAWVCSLLLGWTEFLVRWGVARRWGHAFVPGPSWAWVLGFYGLLALATAALTSRWTIRRGVGLALGVAIALGLIVAWVPRAPGALEAEVLAVGHGLAVVIRTPGGRTLLYDCGRLGDPSVGRRVIAPALWAKGTRRIDEVILSHADADHYNGLPDLLDRFAIGAVRVPPGFVGPSNPGAGRLLDEVQARGIPVRPVVAGDRWEETGARLTVWHPAEGWHPQTTDNARSVVLDLESRGRHALLTGDLEGDGLTELAGRPSREFAVFLSPHHGSRTANPDWLYDWAKPVLVVVSQRSPQAGNKDTLTHLEATHVPLMRTWQRGAVTLRWLAAGVDARGSLDDGGRMTSNVFLLAPWTRVAIAVAGFGLGLMFVVLLAVTEWGAWTLVLPGRRLGRPEEDDEGPGEAIGATAGDGVRLAGLWHPAKGGQVPGRTVLLLHGFAEPTSLRSRIEALNRHGWHVASLDSRGHGRSGGNRTSFGGREAGDLRVWIDVLADRVLPSGTVSVWGRSMGSAVAVRAASDDPRIAALVLESPYVDLEAAVAVVIRRYRVPFPRLLARLIAHRAEVLAGVSLTRPRPIDLAPRVLSRTLIVHGTDDSLVSLPDAQRLASTFPQRAEMIDVGGAGHTNVIDVGGCAVLDQVCAFLDR